MYWIPRRSAAMIFADVPIGVSLLLLGPTYQSVEQVQPQLIISVLATIFVCHHWNIRDGLLNSFHRYNFLLLRLLPLRLAASSSQPLALVPAGRSFLCRGFRRGSRGPICPTFELHLIFTFFGPNRLFPIRPIVLSRQKDKIKDINIFSVAIWLRLWKYPSRG